jgi:aldehyde oxidoreductase
VAVERVVSAHDVGRAINLLSLTGQIDGGIVMGLGNALTEHYIEENGRAVDAPPGPVQNAGHQA